MEGHHEHVHDNDMAGAKSEGGSSSKASGDTIVVAAVLNGADCFFDGSIKFCLEMQLLLCNIVVLVLLCLYFWERKVCICWSEYCPSHDCSSNCGSGGTFAFVFVEDGRPAGPAVTLRGGG